MGFRYDGDGNRLGSIVNSTFTTYTLDVALSLPEVIAEHDGSTTHYLHLPHSIATDDGAAWSYTTADGLGSVRQQLDDSGSVEGVNSYRPFGLPLEGDGGDPYGFTGEQTDRATGLVFLRARYYDPATGRFLSKDPWQGSAWQPGTVHRFIYVRNNSVNSTDPSGHRECGPYCQEDWINWEIDFGSAYYGPWNPAEQARNRARAEQVSALILDFIPLVGDAKGVGEALTGRDLLTEQSLGAWRWLGLLGLSELRPVKHVDGLRSLKFIYDAPGVSWLRRTLGLTDEAPIEECNAISKRIQAAIRGALDEGEVIAVFARAEGADYWDFILDAKPLAAETREDWGRGLRLVKTVDDEIRLVSSDLDLAFGFNVSGRRPSRLTNRRMEEEIGGYINRAYDWDIVQHGDLISGIEMGAKGALRADHLDKTVYLFTKDGCIGQGNFLDVFLSFLPVEP